MRGCSSSSGDCRAPPTSRTPKLDATVFLFALVVSLATGFLFGAIPALKSSRANVAETLKEAGRTAGRSRGRVTVANTLLVGAGGFFVPPAGDGGAVPAQHRAGVPDGSGLSDGASGGVPGQSRTGRIREGAGQSVLPGCARPRGETSGRRVGLVGLQYAVVGASRERPPGGRPASRDRAPTRSATVVNTMDRDYFETAGVAHRKRARVHRRRPGDVAAGSHRE